MNRIYFTMCVAMRYKQVSTANATGEREGRILRLGDVMHWEIKAWASVTLLFVLGGGCAGGQEEMNPKGVFRCPSVAGAFYPGSAKTLEKTVRGFLNRAPEPEFKGEVVAAMAPHAGYVFSGGIAAATHKALSKTQFDTVVIIGHDCHRNAVAFLCPVDGFDTPLGRVAVDTEMVDRMIAFDSGIRADVAMHEMEHTVEVHLPFLQVRQAPCKIVPVLFGDPTLANCQILADAILAASDGRRVLVLASTDMSHYPPYEGAKDVDLSTLKVMERFDPEELFRHLAAADARRDIPNLQTAMCSRGGVGTAMLFARKKGANRIRILGYANSGDVPQGGHDRVVGYGAAVMLREDEAGR